MVLLGIDPGLKCSGFGIAKKTGQKTVLLEYGCLRLGQHKKIAQRLQIFFDFFEGQIKKFGVTDLALETPFLGRNAQNFLKLGYLRGLLYLISSRNGINIFEFAPREVKKSITGYGGASKEQVARVLQSLTELSLEDEPNDVTDALAVTLCGIWMGTDTKSLLYKLRQNYRPRSLASLKRRLS